MSKTIGAVVFSIGSLALGISAVWIVHSVLHIPLSTEAMVGVLFASAIVPVIVYGILMGRFGKITGPLGLELEAVKGRSVDSVDQTIGPSVGEIEKVAKEGRAELARQIHNIDTSRPIILTMTLGKHDYYDAYVLRDYINTLRAFSTFRFVVLLNSDATFFAYMTVQSLISILEKDQLGREFVETINEGQQNNVRQYPGIIATSLPSTSTNVAALREMKSRNLNALLIVDQNRKVRGIIEREQLLSDFVLAFAA